MSNLTTFDFNSMPVRVVEQDGEPWFLASDVRKALNMTGSSQNVYGHLSDSEKSYSTQSALGLAPGKPMVIISESGLYKLVMRSDKPEARAFQDWVTKTVLPAIRKDGAYIMGEEKVATGET